MNAKQELINYNDAWLIQTLKQTVAQGLTDAEFRLFVEYCKATGLNALKKEIWAIKVGGRLQLMTSAAGLFTIANSNPAFDGYESGLIAPGGEFVKASYPENDFIGAWCRVHRKDRKIATEAVAMLSEYDKNQGNWKTMRRTMIIKCAESLGMRKTFPQELNGLYSAEEMPTQYAAIQAPSALPASKVKLSIDIPVEDPDNELQIKTREAMSRGETFTYDLQAIGNNCHDKKQKAELWKEIKAMGGIATPDKVLHSAEELEDFSSHMLSALGTPTRYAESNADDVSFEKESEELERKK